MKKFLFMLLVCLVAFKVYAPKQTAESALPKIRIWGQYTSFLQATDFAYIGDKIKAAGYNGYHVHGLSPWGAIKTCFPWLFDATAYDSKMKRKGLFDLSKINPFYRQHVRSLLEEIPGKRKQWLEVALFDFYYKFPYVAKGASTYHPLRNNKQGIDWSFDTDALGASLPWFQHVSWVTHAPDGQFSERVIDYDIKPKYKWLWAYINLWGQEIKLMKETYPAAKPVLVRYVNEAFTRYNAATGEFQNKEGGEDKIYQILIMEWKKLGLTHGKDFIIVDDHMVFAGNRFVAFTENINGNRITGWAPGGKFDRQPDLKWFREVHATGFDELNLIKESAKRYPQYAGFNFTIVSNDSWKPEDKNYIKDLRVFFHSDMRIVDIKVPSEIEVTQSTLLLPKDRNHRIDYPYNIKKYIDAVYPVMARIAQK